MQEGGRTVKQLLNICICRGEKENTSESGHCHNTSLLPEGLLRVSIVCKKSLCAMYGLWTQGFFFQHSGGDHWNEKNQVAHPRFQYK